MYREDGDDVDASDVDDALHIRPFISGLHVLRLQFEPYIRL